MLSKQIRSLYNKAFSRCLQRLARHEMPAVYLIAEPGYPNYGDELIAREWLRYLADTYPKIRVFLDCMNPGQAAAILHDANPNLVVVDTIAQLTVGLMSDDEKKRLGGEFVEELSNRVVAALDNEGNAARCFAGIHILQRDVGLVHYLGGGYMNGMWQENLARLSLAIWAGRRGVPVIGTGIGFAPLGGPSLAFAALAVKSFDYLSVRDAKSQELLSEKGCSVSLAPDDCFVHHLCKAYSPEDALPRYMICAQTDLVSDSSELNDFVSALLDSWGVPLDEEVGVVECVPYTDYAVLEHLKAEGRNCRLFPAAYLLEVGFPARSEQCWITTRYHPHILASLQGCSGVCIVVNDDYYSGKHDAVLRMGSHWTKTVVGTDAVDIVPGKGFDSEDAGDRYAKSISEAVRPFYSSLAAGK